jgi:hypothetical protein
MRIVVTKHTPENQLNDTFELVGGFWDTYVLNPSSVPDESSIDFSGYEYSGQDGGYNSASRYQRRPFNLNFTITERWDNEHGLFDLYARAKTFFDPHNDDLSCIRYDIDFYTCDKENKSFRMQNGAITVPLNMKGNANESSGEASVSFIFADPYLYYTGEEGDGITKFTLVQSVDISGMLLGRLWEYNPADDTAKTGASWSPQPTGKIWFVPDGYIPGGYHTVEVQTSKTIYADIILTGRVINATITNLTNGSSVNIYGGNDGVVQYGSIVHIYPDGHYELSNVPGVGNTQSVRVTGRLTADNGVNRFIMYADRTTYDQGTAQIELRGII